MVKTWSLLKVCQRSIVRPSSTRVPRAHARHRVGCCRAQECTGQTLRHRMIPTGPNPSGSGATRFDILHPKREVKMEYLNDLINAARAILNIGFDGQALLGWKELAFLALLGLSGPLHYYRLRSS